MELARLESNKIFLIKEQTEKLQCFFSELVLKMST